jgi:hypothetical protein
MKRSNFALRLQPSLLEEARRTAEEEGVALNQLISVAVAEKLSALRTQAFFRARTRQANVPEAIEILDRLGKGNPPVKGDKLAETERHSSAETGRKRSRRVTPGRISPASAKRPAPRSSQAELKVTTGITQVSSIEGHPR